MNASQQRNSADSVRNSILQLPQMRIPARDPTRTIVPIAELERDLEVRIPKSTDLRPNDVIKLTRGGEFFGDEKTITQAELDDPALTEFTLLFRMAEFPAKGTDVFIDLDYGVYDPDSEDGEPSGIPVRTRFDQLAPAGVRPPPIAFTDEQLDGITDADLIDDKLPLLINPYYQGEAEDKIEFWIGSREDIGSGIWLPQSFDVTNPSLSTAGFITRAELESMGDGRRFFAYRVTDWAGNVSAPSSPVAIDVFIQLPALQAPLIPEADDGLITYNDAYPEVDVQIPAYPGASVGDEIVVTWGGQTMPPYRLTAQDVGNAPILVTLPVPFASALAQGNGPVDVTYTLRRGNRAPVNAPITQVQVNLRTPGGPDPDPDPENPVHGNIQPPVVKCGTSPDNTIEARDFGKDAEALIPRLGKDGNPIWVEGDIIQLYWHGQGDPGLQPIHVNAANGSADIRYPIPFDPVIKTTGTGEYDVYFTITRLLGANPAPIPVHVSSPTQLVKVSAGSQVPGGEDPLAPPTFPDANARNIIVRAVGMAGTRFRIPLSGVKNIELSRNPRVSYDFHGVSVPLGQYQPPTGDAPVIEASRITGEQALIQADIDRGYVDVLLPYSKTYFICRNGGFAEYSLSNDAGASSPPDRGYVYFALNRGGGVCDVPSA
ncbi:hypothetical protein [uncultured Pseudomonas sp.]|uniref:hypothetical protein n=1 Tax=uncultured Pseudomonas sp. TaxID=114707 RepID=UPI0025CB8C96|nr:hypothetical protein [uncultured Pseudomonas sp.]